VGKDDKQDEKMEALADRLWRVSNHANGMAGEEKTISILHIGAGEAVQTSVDTPRP
jgi:hypothetical protein